MMVFSKKMITLTTRRMVRITTKVPWKRNRTINHLL